MAIDKFITLISLILDEKHQGGKVLAIHNLINGIAPNGWQADRCLNCDEPITGAVVNSKKKLRITVSDSSIPLTHSPCGH